MAVAPRFMPKAAIRTSHMHTFVHIIVSNFKFDPLHSGNRYILFYSPYVIALRLLCGSEPHLIRHFFQLYHDDQALPIPSTIQNYIPNCAPHFVQCAVRNLDHILRHLWHERWCHHITAAIMESFLCSHSLLACLLKIHAWLILIVSIVIECFIVICHFLALIQGTQCMALCLSYCF